MPTITKKEWDALVAQRPELAQLLTTGPATDSPGASPSKYNNRKIDIDGHTFDSRKEGRRYQYLKSMLEIGSIRDLKIHPTYALIVNGIEVAYYEADFEYLQDGEKVIEDCKGMRTDVYKLKRKLMKAIYGVDIREV